VTIEDGLEQIVGDIEDEYDFERPRTTSLPGERPLSGQGADRDRRLQRKFGSEFSDGVWITIGGLG
jgi:Mg2+/Co2+ transporter CorC